MSERSTGELSFGAGYSTSDGPLGDIRLSERNFLGRGQSIQANFTISGRTQEIDFGFTEPYFLDREVAAGFDLFRRSTNFQSEGSFDQRTTGGTLRANYPLTERWRHGLRLTVREDVIHNVDNDASQFIQDEEGNALTVLLGQDLTYDTRDTRFLPSDGYIVALNQDIADSAPTRSSCASRGGSYYYPFYPDWVLNVPPRRLHPGLGEDVRLFDRFFLGGASFRGFKFAGVGPRDTSTGDALGGKLLYTARSSNASLGSAGGAQDFWQGFVEAGSLVDPDVSGPTVFDSSAPGPRPAAACPGCRRRARSPSTWRTPFSRRTRTRPNCSVSVSARASERRPAVWRIGIAVNTVIALTALVVAWLQPWHDQGAARRSRRPRSPR